MNIKIYNRLLALIGLIIVVFAVIWDIYWAEELTYLVYLCVGFTLLKNSTELKGPFIYSFFLFSVLALINQMFIYYQFQSEISLILYSLAIISLIVEVFKYIKIKNARVFLLLYFFVVTAVIFYFLCQHVYEITSHLHSNLSIAIYLFYYLNLFVLGITALIYCLNSYSRKSMFFVTLSLTVIISNVFRDMQIFYLRDISVQITEGVLCIISLFFVISFFDTSEKKLQLVNFI